MRRNRRAGFTLVELMVSLTIAAIVLLSARAILEQIADSADRTTAAAIQADRTANTEYTIRALFEHTIASDSAHPFSGNTQSLRFASWCDVPAGWTEPCDVVAAISRDSLHGGRTTVSTSRGDTLVLGNDTLAAELRYLTDAANGGQWATGWSAGMTTPLAVGIVTMRDTIVLRIGERR